MVTLPARRPADIRSETPCVAAHRSQLRQACRLVYQSYLAAGLAPPNRHQMRATPHHLLPTTQVMVAEVRGRVSATLTLVRDGELGLPMEAVFPREVSRRRDRGVRCAEVTALAAGSDQLCCSFSGVVRLIGFATQFAIAHGVDEGLIAVHPRHAGFYERFFGFEVINGQQRAYSSVCGQPAVALSLDLNQLQRSVSRAQRRLLQPSYSRSDLEARPLKRELVKELAEVVEGSSQTANGRRPKSIPVGFGPGTPAPQLATAGAGAATTTPYDRVAAASWLGG